MKRYRELNVKREKTYLDINGSLENMSFREHKRRKELRKERISNTSESHDHQTENLKYRDIKIVIFLLKYNFLLNHVIQKSTLYCCIVIGNEKA